MEIQLDKDNYITGYATVGGFVDGIEVSEEVINSLEDEKIGSYKYVNGEVVFDAEHFENRQAEIAKEEQEAISDSLDLRVEQLQAQVEYISILTGVDLV